MKVLSVNAGSSSFKFRMYEKKKKKVIISGRFERIGDRKNWVIKRLKYRAQESITLKM